LQIHFNIFTAFRWLKEDCFSKDSVTSDFKLEYAVTFDPHDFKAGHLNRACSMEQVNEVT